MLSFKKKKKKKKNIVISLDNTVFECGFYFFSQTVDDYYRPHRRWTLVLQHYNMFIKKLSQKYNESDTVCAFYINFHAILVFSFT